MNLRAVFISVMQAKALIVKLVFVLLIGISVQDLYADTRIDSLKTRLGSNSADTSLIRVYLQLGDRYAKLNQADSALSYYNRALKVAEKPPNNAYSYAIFNQIGLLFSSTGNYSISLEYYFKMLQMLDDEALHTPDKAALNNKYASLYVQMGTCYFYQENLPKAHVYYQKSLEKVLQKATLNATYKETESQLILYINIGSAYLSGKSFDKALLNFEKALEMNKPLKNQIYYGVLYNNLGIVYKEKKDFPRALDYYNKCLDIRTRLEDTAGMAQIFNNLGDYYYLKGDFDKSIAILNKALEFSRKTGNIRSQMKAANFLSMTYEKINMQGEALAMYKLFKQLNDSIINSEQIQSTARLELQYQYEKQRKESELQQEIQLARKERKALIYLILAGLLLFSFVIVMLLNRNQRIKMKQAVLIQDSLQLESANLSLEKQNLILEKQNLELELDFRNKELATHVMYLLKKNEFIGSITEKLLALKPLLLAENKVWLQEIVREMRSNIDNTVWGEFEVRFQQVHKDFYLKLSERYPDLTPNETKLCAFMRLNMTSKDISAITFQSIKSIQVARARLRKKMGIARDENLVTILQQL